jgi:hypothetical protein
MIIFYRFNNDLFNFVSLLMNNVTNPKHRNYGSINCNIWRFPLNSAARVPVISVPYSLPKV